THRLDTTAHPGTVRGRGLPAASTSHAGTGRAARDSGRGRGRPAGRALGTGAPSAGSPFAEGTGSLALRHAAAAGTGRAARAVVGRPVRAAGNVGPQSHARPLQPGPSSHRTR